jgi:hypothetical protein
MGKEKLHHFLPDSSSFPSRWVGLATLEPQRRCHSINHSIKGTWHNLGSCRTRPNIHRTNAGIGSSVVMPAPRFGGRLAKLGKAADTEPAIGPIAPCIPQKSYVFHVPARFDGDRDGLFRSCPCPRPSTSWRIPHTRASAMALLFPVPKVTGHPLPNDKLGLVPFCLGSAETLFRQYQHGKKDPSCLDRHPHRHSHRSTHRLHDYLPNAHGGEMELLRHLRRQNS